MSSGVFINTSHGLMKIINAAVRMMPMIKERIAAPATVFLIVSISPAPNFWAVSTVNPAVIPTTNP